MVATHWYVFDLEGQNQPDGGMEEVLNTNCSVENNHEKKQQAKTNNKYYLCRENHKPEKDKISLLFQDKTPDVLLSQ